MIKILHSSDLHLGKSFKSFKDKELGHIARQKLVLQKLLNAAKEKAINIVILAGDTFDSPYPSQSSAYLFEDFAKELAALNIYLLVAVGNHDLIEPGSIWHRLLSEQTRVLQPQIKEGIAYYRATSAGSPGFIITAADGIGSVIVELPELGVRVLSTNVLTKTRATNTLKDIIAELRKKASIDQQEQSKDYIDICLCHAGVDIIESNSNTLAKEEIKTLSELGVRYLALGDWHGYMNLEELTTDKFVAAYSGAPEVLDTKQDNCGSCNFVQIDENKTSIERCKLSELELIKKVFNVANFTAEGIIDELKQLTNPNVLLDCKLEGDYPMLVEGGKYNSFAELATKLEQLYQDKFYLFRVEDKTNPLIALSEVQDYPEGSIPRLFVEAVAARTSSGELTDDLADSVLKYGLSLIMKE
jgi:exonuclease SbcD